jgi:hypothetical protein
MKKIAIIMFALATCLMAQDYSGSWSGVGGKEDTRYGSVPQTAQITILQGGTAITGGTLKMGSSNMVSIKSGTVSGSQLTFVAVFPGGGQVTGNFTQSSGQLTGKMYGSNGEVYDFVFTKK